MTVQTDHENRAVWVPRLIDWWEQGRDHFAAVADQQRRNGCRQNAEGYDALAAKYQGYADRARVLLVDLSEPTTDEPPAHNHTDHCLTLNCGGYLSQEPPSTLVELVNWLRAHIGAHFPWVPAEVWQRIGYLILMARGLRP